MQIGQDQSVLRRFICRNDSKSKHSVCLHSSALLGILILFLDIGHIKQHSIRSSRTTNPSYVFSKPNFFLNKSLVASLERFTMKNLLSLLILRIF